MKKKFLIYIFILTAICGVFIITAVANYILRVPNTLDIYYGDKFPEVSLYSDEKKQFHFDDIFNVEQTVVFYLSNSCASCIQKLPEIQQILNVFSSSEINMVLLWEDKIPIKKTNYYRIPKNHNFTLNSEVLLSNITPMVFMVNKESEISFISYDIQTLVNKLFSMADEKDLYNSGIASMINDFDNEDSSKSNKVVIFTTGKCETCEIVTSNVENISKEKNIDLLKYSEFGIYDDDRLVEFYNIFRRIFNIDFFPTYLVIDNEKKIFRSTDENEIISILN